MRKEKKEKKEERKKKEKERKKERKKRKKEKKLFLFQENPKYGYTVSRGSAKRERRANGS